jgi:hypothetical protein
VDDTDEYVDDADEYVDDTDEYVDDTDEYVDDTDDYLSEYITSLIKKKQVFPSPPLSSLSTSSTNNLYIDSTRLFS